VDENMGACEMGRTRSVGLGFRDVRVCKEARRKQGECGESRIFPYFKNQNQNLSFYNRIYMA